MTPVSETRQSLMDRLSKLRELMLYIRHNGVLSLVRAISTLRPALTPAPRLVPPPSLGAR
jgi:hypothetical protein